MQLCKAPSCGALLRAQPIGARRARPSSRRPLAVRGSLLTDALLQVWGRARVGGLGSAAPAAPQPHRWIAAATSVAVQPRDDAIVAGGPCLPPLPPPTCRRRLQVGMVGPVRGHSAHSQLHPTTPTPCKPQGAISFDNAPPEALLAGGAVALLALAGIGYAAAQQAGGPAAGKQAAPERVLPREDAVLVFGATGRMGRTIVNSVRPAGLLRLPGCRAARAASTRPRWGPPSRLPTASRLAAAPRERSCSSRGAPWWRRCAPPSARPRCSARRVPRQGRWRWARARAARAPPPPAASSSSSRCAAGCSAGLGWAGLGFQ